jgi:peptide/nickel transport system permease protein
MMEPLFSFPETLMSSTELVETNLRVAPPNALAGFMRYTLRRGAVIFLTILLGTYLSVLVANKGGQVDSHVESKVALAFRQVRRAECALVGEEGGQAAQEACYANTLENLRDAAGLNLPPTLRNLRFTLNSLVFNWGKANFIGTPSYFQQYSDRSDVRALILEHFPNTLLLFGTADLIIFLVGIPLALHLSTRGRRYWLDRMISIIVPLSSVPSWVHGVILVSIFAVTFRLLPYSGKYGILPATNLLDLFLIVARHMILPVAAILLSVFFHLVYTWRTYFLIHSDEDYVELAVAKGLPKRMLGRRYILQTSMPFLLTSFALTLVGFWQMSTALEYFFNWPGLGLLYVNAVPNFWGESYFPGEMGVVLSIVVIFAYLLGLVVFLLDILYAWLDPRIRVDGDERQGPLARKPAGILQRIRSWKPTWRVRRRPAFRPQIETPALRAGRVKRPFLQVWLKSLKSAYRQSKGVLGQIFHYPSALLGLALITIFTAGSLYAVIALPYAEIGATWHRESITGKVYTPKSVPPAWTNWFRRQDIPETLILNSAEGDLNKTISVNESGNKVIDFSTAFDYPYQDFPQDIILYIDVTFFEKHPHLTLTWITPDGREIDLKSPSLETDLVYNFSDHVGYQRLTRQYPNFNAWFDLDSTSPTSKHDLLFADPESTEPIAFPGTYQLEINALTFEEGTDVNLEFVMLGGVYGFAGTDQLGRDLTVPLFWGMPFTLAFGVLGALGTTVLAMILAAFGVWTGGWADIIVQRLSEANMILPVLAIGILVFALYGVSLWTIIAVIILLGAFGSTTKAFRAAFLQVKEAPYIESARAYGARGPRIIFRYMIPRIVPTLIPQFINLIPSLVFLEATLAIFNAFDPRFPTWGRVIYDAINQGALWGGAAYRVLVPISLLLLIGLAFALVGFAIERILNPRQQNV